MTAWIPCAVTLQSGKACPKRAAERHPDLGPICGVHARHLRRTKTRTVAVAVRLTPAETTTIQAAADLHGLTVSEYMRRLTLAYPLPAIPRLVLAGNVDRQVAAIGNNLNQLARSLNSMEWSEQMTLLKDVLAAVKDAERTVSDMKTFLIDVASTEPEIGEDE